MKYVFLLCSTLCLLFSSTKINAQNTYGSTLLWRISGNGLQQPSYLYGTMHLKDRRLFFFGDSVYKSLESTAGFAMEIDPDAYMDSIFSRMSESDTTSLLKKLYTSEEYDKIAKKIEKKLGISADQMTRKKLISLKNSGLITSKKDDMKASVDFYLYGLAKQQGKWLGGIEDVSDQIELKDELGKNVDILYFIDKAADKKQNQTLEKLIEIYLSQNIDEVENVYGRKFSTARDLLLIRRNGKMASRIDSLAHIRNTFFAVGVAHLPGDSGLIELLHHKGFTVQPVFSYNKVVPEKYTFIPVNLPWIKFYEKDSAYTVEMPGKPSDLKIMGDALTLKVYSDLSNGMTYMTGFTFASINDSPAEKLERIVKSFAGKGFTKYSEKKIIKNDMEGMEVIAVREGLFYRLRFYTVKNKIFLLMAGGEKKESLYTTGPEKFFKSFTANTMLEARPNNWVDYKYAEKAFEISFPTKPSIDRIPFEKEGGSMSVDSYSAIDIPNNTFYMVAINETKKGYLITDDSLLFNSKTSYYKENDAIITNFRKFDFEGYNAISFNALMHKDGADLVSKVLVICRGNRSYTLVAITEKGREDFPDISRFFRSFQFTPSISATWLKQNGPANQFSTWAPSPLEVEEKDTAATEEGVSNEAPSKANLYIAFDPHTVNSYYIYAEPLSKYYWAENDSSFFEEQSTSVFIDSTNYYARNNPGNYDSLIYKKAVTNGTVKGVEVMVKNASRSYYKRIRILQHGDSTYQLYTMAPYAVITSENYNRFFNDFRFANEQLPTTIFANKVKLILADIHSTDSAIRSDAVEALVEARFTTADLPLLHKAYLEPYPLDTNDYRTVPDRLVNIIRNLNDTSTIAFVKDNYATIPAGSEDIKIGMLDMLAAQKKLPAILLLKQYLLQDTFKSANANGLFYQLADSLLLAKALFPEVSRLYGDSVVGPGIIRVVTALIDSGLLEKDILKSNLSGVFLTAKKQLRDLQNNKEAYPPFRSFVTTALEKINTKESIELLRDFLKVKTIYIKNDIVLSLLRLNQAVPAEEIKKVAGDVYQRTEFYNALKKIGKEKVFPSAYLSQQHFAASYLANYGQDEDAGDNIDLKFIAEKTATVKGVQSRYYLFKMTTVYDEETTSNLAVCGPFDMNKSKPEVKKEYGDMKIFYEEKFDPKTTNKLFENYIQELDEEKK